MPIASCKVKVRFAFSLRLRSENCCYLAYIVLYKKYELYNCTAIQLLGCLHFYTKKQSPSKLNVGLPKKTSHSSSVLLAHCHPLSLRSTMIHQHQHLPARQRNKKAICAQRRIVLATSTPPTFSESIHERLNALVSWLQFWQRADDDELSTNPEQDGGGMLSRDGPLGLLRLWQRHEGTARDAVGSATESLRATIEGRASDAREALDRFFDATDELPAAEEVEEKARSLLTYAAQSLTPWDFDRREPGLTFVHNWQVDEMKITSTWKPLYQEWKLSARTRLPALSSEQGVIFGKAGLYLAGDLPPYVGLEADRVVCIPRIPRSHLFANVNYRSSRKPFAAVVVASAGLQHTIRIGEGNGLTLRAGWSTKDCTKPFSISIMSSPEYF